MLSLREGVIISVMIAVIISDGPVGFGCSLAYTTRGEYHLSSLTIVTSCSATDHYFYHFYQSPTHARRFLSSTRRTHALLTQFQPQIQMLAWAFKIVPIMSRVY